MRFMGVPCTYPTAVSAIGPTAVGSVLWDNCGQLHLSAVVKATFALRHDAPMVIAKSVALCDRDVHQDDDPTRSLVAASDLVPYRPQADVWMTGHAHAPQGRRVTVSVVRLALYREQVALLDKVVYVVGDRRVSAPDPVPYASMPLTYERAYGGIGFDDNPVGVGADERPEQPNLVHPDKPERSVAFGPISRYWKLRRGSLGTVERRRVEAEIPGVPRGFDWGYFQAAPLDQRVPFLAGDEWLVLDGVHPAMARIQSRLPKARGVARLLTIRGEGRGDAIALVADTLAIDADAQTCAITWRGNVAVPSRESVRDMLVAGGVELAQREVDWSRARALATPSLSRPASSAPSGDGAAEDLGATSIDPRHPSDPTLPALDVGDSAELSSGTYERLEVDSGEWSSDAWPSFPLGAEGDEVTETKTRIDGEPPHSAMRVHDERPTEVERDGVPLAVDTEPGAPPAVIEDELPWVNEVPVEPDTPGAAPVTSAVEVTSAAEATRASPPGVAGGAKHVSDMRPRAGSLPPAPLDLSTYEASLRRAGASEDDIEKLVQRFRQEAERRGDG
jgi:hypothetical protein